LGSWGGELVIVKVVVGNVALMALVVVGNVWTWVCIFMVSIPDFSKFQVFYIVRREAGHLSNA
jgi:hypothetical protein